MCTSATSASTSATRSSRRSSARPPRSVCEELPKPREIYEFLDGYVDRPGAPPRRRSRSRSTTTTSGSRPGRAGRPARKDEAVELAKSNILLHRPDRLRQDLPRADAGPDAQRPVRDRRRHRADRGRLCRRGRREHPAEADPGRRLRRQEGRDRHHLHRRDRQGRPQEREPVDHPRRLRRGRPAGAAEDPGGHHRLRAAAGRPQAPAPGVHPDRHHEHPVHRRRRLRRSGADHRAAGRQARRSASAPSCRTKAGARHRATVPRGACRRTC